jgi:hypothetical protein
MVTINCTTTTQYWSIILQVILSAQRTENGQKSTKTNLISPKSEREAISGTSEK